MEVQIFPLLRCTQTWWASHHVTFGRLIKFFRELGCSDASDDWRTILHFGLGFDRNTANSTFDSFSCKNTWSWISAQKMVCWTELKKSDSSAPPNTPNNLLNIEQFFSDFSDQKISNFQLDSTKRGLMHHILFFKKISDQWSSLYDVIRMLFVARRLQREMQRIYQMHTEAAP